MWALRQPGPDNNSKPTQVVLCPRSCATAGASAGGSISVNISAPASFGSRVLGLRGAMPGGAAPIWGYFACRSHAERFDVAFRARCQQPGWAGRQLPTLKTASAASAPGLPAQRRRRVGRSVRQLSIPDARYPFLELGSLNDTDKLSIPSVSSWQLTYSCPPAE
jgi:hypothetical protein